MGISRGRVAFGLGASAVGWALLLFAAAFVFPAYQGETCGSSGCTSTSSTLFAENGWWVVALLLIVALVATLAFWALHVRCARRSTAAGTVATFCILALTAFSLVTGLSVGFYVLPVVILLTASAKVTPLAGGRRAE